jgi:pyruvate/2-oxoglutarate dehydrogenase complex dihydrolipoamide acyltransferase (E2) component
MPTPSDNYQIVPFPLSRQPIIDYLSVAQSKHVVHGLTEMDVTRARLFIRQHKEQTGETLSFTAFIIACLGQAVGENKLLHAYRISRKRLILFDEVDISTPVEHQIGDQRVGTPYVIRAANRKTFRQIHDEIRQTQAREAGPYKNIRWYRYLPSFAMRLFWHSLRRNPHWRKKFSGTVGVTAIGMFGKGAGWGIPITDYTLQLTLGGITERPAAVEGRIEIREMLSLTISVDHDIVDGAPAARFAARLKELIEAGVQQ